MGNQAKRNLKDAEAYWNLPIAAVVFPVCNECIHLDREDPSRCEAFPERIPNDILGGSINHIVHYPGDNGVIFKQRPTG